MQKSSAADYDTSVNRKIFLTQPDDLFPDLPKLLEQTSLEVCRIPISEWYLLEHNRLLYQALRQIEMYDWLILSGRREAELFFAMLWEMHIDVRALRTLKMISTCKEVSLILKQKGLIAALSCSDMNQTQILQKLTQRQSRRERYLVLWDAVMPDFLIQEFSRLGISYDAIPISGMKKLSHPQISFCRGDMVLFCDSNSVTVFCETAKESNYHQIVALCLTDAALTAAKKMGFRLMRIERVTADGIIDAVKTYQKETEKVRFDRDAADEISGDKI